MDRKQIRWNGWGRADHHDEMAGREDVWAWLAHELGMPSLLVTPAHPLEDITLAPSRLSDEQKQALSGIAGDLRDDVYERAFHALGDSYHDLLRLRGGDLSTAPDAVAYPRSGEAVLKLLAYASENGIAVVPFGGGSSVVGAVSGGSGPFKAAIALDTSGMDQLVSVDREAGTATAQAGIYGPALETALNADGITLGHFPQSFEFSTLGGWIAHRGSGQSSHGYGRAEDWLIALKMATPQGMIATEDFPPNSVGPDLNDIALGSEGVFGAITEATFRVRPVPVVKDYRGWLFHDFERGTQAIRRAAADDLPVTMLRLSDPEETRFYRAFGSVGKKRGLKDLVQDIVLRRRGFGPGMCVLIAGFEGEKEKVEASRKRFETIARGLGAMSIGRGQGERWQQGRFHGPYSRDPMMDRGVGVDTLETAASWPKLAGLHRAVTTALETAIVETAPRPGALGIVMAHISHFYPHGASLYFTYIFPRQLDNEIGQWQTIKRAATDAIVANGGTISHHHGVGEDHLPWMAQEKGALGIEVLRAIKKSLDPKGVMNPGKLIPD
ncbi:MAG TPA: FAD-binding oxidoreductase [Rhizomicrobium sp.]|jgi:alkyldihydroxyacetonephosphate synthase|nr:FAD-binding oxidoreductase [Rhizomicrobium sp.]